MAAPATIFHFKIDLSDVDRSVYESLDFRVAQHPSESLPYLMTRILAYALNYGDASFSTAGLADPDSPALSAPDEFGGVKLWIEIGNPSPRKLHKASKAAKKVKVYTYKNPDALIRTVAAEQVHRASEIELYSFTAEFLEALANTMDRENRWSILNQGGAIMVTVGEKALHGELSVHSFEQA